ncbi:gliding motility-associated lipoprotein GldB [Catalinimonas alkaloidigena]|uniref:gliding motility lipoprotein GldB n=1 Tax=Catalinimonas alkaloidigena TaxID=1075417 RepID=UPI002405304B|nr:gliding motility lipoprotein GldB [Catalinimonas alkaloidigena]MDF9795012.1 gliding motility-associated lipoprotein GldB [Catalinimonas alkaloidigena]
MKYIYIIIYLFCTLLFSCSSDSCDEGPNISGIPMEVNIQRLDQEMFDLDNREEISGFLDRYPLMTEHFLKADQFPHDSILVNELDRIIHDPHVDTLYQQTQTAFPDLEMLESQFEDAFRHIKHYYPAFTPPKVYATFTALATVGADLFVSDELIVISIEHFLGEDARFRPRVYDYIINRYRPEYIVPNCVMLLSNKWNQTDMEDNTLLAEMVYYGKSYYFTQKMMPCLPDTVLTGYTDQDLAIAEENDQLIWSHFINRELLYETSHIIKPRYVGERPNVAEINAKIPGRIGRWLGWQIVQTYVDKTDTSVQAVMSNADAQEIFTQARYKP